MKQFVVIYDSNTGKSEIQEYTTTEEAYKVQHAEATKHLKDPTINIYVIESEDRESLERQWKRYFHKII